MTAGDTVDLEIDSLAAGGEGIGRDPNGRVTFVRRTAVGDRVRVAIDEEHRRFARGHLLEVLTPGPGRAEPHCPLFVSEACGGCQWQHLERAVQVSTKREIVVNALRKVVSAERVTEAAAPGPAYAWRRRARLHWFRPRGSQRAILGFTAPRSRRLTVVEACPQLTPALNQLLPVLQERLAPALHKRGDVEVLAGREGQIHMAIHGPVNRSAARELVGVAGIIGVRVGARTFGEEAVELEPGLSGSAHGFAQAQEEGNAALVASVIRAAQPLAGARVLELFAGSGNFTRGLAEAAREVVAVDRVAPAAPVERPGLRFVRGRAERVMQAMRQRRERFDLVLLDPPRAGARELMPALAALEPIGIVYVSCDPATLARDLQVLVEAGYGVEQVEPLDLMPQTAHIECVARLRLRAGPQPGAK